MFTKKKKSAKILSPYSLYVTKFLTQVNKSNRKATIFQQNPKPNLTKRRMKSINNNLCWKKKA